MLQIKGFFGTAQAIVLVVVIAILSWKYFLSDLFFSDAPVPRAEVSHQIFSACLNEDARWLRAMVRVKNVGEAEIKLAAGQHSVAQISPADDLRETPRGQATPIAWPEIVATRDADAGMLLAGKVISRELDFVIDPAVQVIELTSQYRAVPQEKDEQGKAWQKSTVYAVGDAECQG